MPLSPKTGLFLYTRGRAKGKWGSNHESRKEEGVKLKGTRMQNFISPQFITLGESKKKKKSGEKWGRRQTLCHIKVYAERMSQVWDLAK